MPSPAISAGDLLVFLAVVAIVIVFLAVVRWFISRSDPSATPAQQPRPQATESQAGKPRDSGSQQLTSSQSASG